MNIDEALIEADRQWEAMLADQQERVRLTAEAAGVGEQRAGEIVDEELGLAGHHEGGPGALTAAFDRVRQRITMEGT